MKITPIYGATYLAMCRQVEHLLFIYPRETVIVLQKNKFNAR